MSKSSGTRLASQYRWLAISGVAVLVLSVLIAATTGDYLYVGSIVVTLAVLIPLLAILQRNHRRRRAEADVTGAFGATCNVYYENLKDIPRFRPLLSDFSMPWWSKLPSTLPRMQQSVMGGSLRIDTNGVTWTPSAYRQRKGMPILHVSLQDVESVSRQPLVAIGRGGVLELRLRHGGEWMLTLQDSDAALSHLAHLGC